MSSRGASKPALLCIVPPYTTNEPPASAAYLLAFARNCGCDDFGFLDLRLGVPDAYAPTYYHTGIFGECYVMDIPDLPLVLRLLSNFDSGADLLDGLSAETAPYCLDRGIPAPYVEQYLRCLDAYLKHAAGRCAGVRLIGFSTWTSNYLSTLLFAAHLKRLPNPPAIVLGGPQVTESRASTALALRSRLADVVAHGEGEATLLDIYSHIEPDGTLRHGPLPGTAVLAGGDVVYGPKRRLLQSHDVPVPVFDQMPLRSYHEDGSRSVPYHLSRGCTDRCVFCSEWKFWERFRPGEALSTIDGIKKLQKDYRVEEISFTDSLLNGHPRQLRQFAEGLLSAGVEVRWNGFMRANMDVETARLLKRAGCDGVFVGVESMSNETLALMKKRRTEEHNVSALHAFLQAGISVTAGLIPGFPKDERVAFIHTAERLRELQRSYRGLLSVNVEPFIVSPGQPLFASLDTFGLRGVPWDERVLEIAPKYRDITQAMFCTVEGSNQGIERIGRLRIAESIESDEMVRTDPFHYQGDETLSSAEFEFSHLREGWFLARLKGPAAWIYALILNEQEKNEIEAATVGDVWGDTPEAAALRRTLARIARAHIVKPAQLPTPPEGGYVSDRPAATCYRLSPFVIARAANARTGRRIFVADFVDAMWLLVAPWQGRLIGLLERRGGTIAQAQAVLRRSRAAVGPGRCAAAIKALVEDGMVLVANGVAEQPADRPAPAHALVPEQVWRTPAPVEALAS